MDSRSHHRYPVTYPVIFAGAPFVGEGTLSNLSHTGCSITCDRTVLAGSYIKLNALLPSPVTSLHVELGRIRWVQDHSFGVEFIRLPLLANRQLDRAGWERFTALLQTRSGRATHFQNY